MTHQVVDKSTALPVPMAVGILASHCSGLAAPMLHYVFYIASAVAAAALMMMMPPRGISSRSGERR